MSIDRVAAVTRLQRRSATLDKAARASAWICIALLVVVGCESSKSVSPPAKTAAAPQLQLGAPGSWAAGGSPTASRLPRCTGDAFTIDLLDAVAALPDGMLAAQREQLRDWIWSVTLARIARQTSFDDVFVGVADQPLVRDDALEHALRMPTGITRSVTTRAGQVIVLVEAVDDPAITAEVIEAIDDEALALGRAPEHVQIFAYELALATAEAKVCKIGELDRARLESPDSGYRTAKITSLAQLESFLSGGVDLLSAECSASGLQVSGRRRPRTTQAPLTSEHIAVLAQRLGARFIPPAHFGVTRASLSDDERRDLEQMAAQLDQLFGHLELNDLRRASGQLGLDQDTLATLTSLRSWREANPQVPTSDLLLSYQMQRALDGKPGFSLDPAVAAADAMRALDELLAVIAELPKLEQLLRSWNQPETADAIQGAAPALLVEAREHVQAARRQLSFVDSGDIAAVLWAPATSEGMSAQLAAQLLKHVYERTARQCARYDGPLAGTATGMIFFYTDLSAKFFARDSRRMSPEGQIDGFQSVVHHVGTSAWCAEDQHNATRIWFGLRDEAYVREREGRVRFAPTATRLFAKGSNVGSEENEGEPPPDYRRFIRWWDDNYARIAAWDPQYEALNQLMKWSVVVQTARLTDARACLGYLDAARARTDLRLHEWASRTPALRWQQAVAEVTTAGTGRECLPLINSDAYGHCGDTRSLIGGVSAGSLEQVRAKPLRDSIVPKGYGRLAGDVGPSIVKPGEVAFERITRSGGGELNNVSVRSGSGRVEFVAEINPNAPQAGSLGFFEKQAPIQRMQKLIEGNEKSLSIQQNDNGLARLHLKASDLDLANVHVEVTPGTVQEATTLARRIAEQASQHGLSIDGAARSLGIDHTVLSGGDIAVTLEGAGSRAYMLVSAGGGGTRGPPGSRLGLAVGWPDGRRRRSGDLWLPERHTLSVWILPDRSAKEYIASRSVREVRAEAITPALQSALTAADRRRALALFERKPSTAAAEALLGHALDAGDIPTAKRLVAELATERAQPIDFSRLREVLVQHRARVERQGGETAELADLSMQLAIAERRGPPTPSEEALVAQLSPRVVAPVAYPREARLPPVIHPRGAALKPSERYVSRVVEIPIEFLKVKTMRTEWRETYELRSGPAAATRTADWAGPAVRIVAQSVPAVLILSCSDTDDSRPPCHERLSVEERKRQLDAVVDGLCDLDHDGTATQPLEQTCVRELEACERAAAGDWSSRRAQVCVADMYRRHPSLRQALSTDKPNPE